MTFYLLLTLLLTLWIVSNYIAYLLRPQAVEIIVEYQIPLKSPIQALIDYNDPIKHVSIVDILNEIPQIKK